MLSAQEQQLTFEGSAQSVLEHSGIAPGYWRKHCMDFCEHVKHEHSEYV